jgi:hypothetical protein
MHQIARKLTINLVTSREMSSAPHSKLLAWLFEKSRTAVGGTHENSITLERIQRL